MAWRDDVLALAAPTSYWKLDETAGTNAADEQAAVAGTYDLSPALGNASLVPADPAGKSILLDDAAGNGVLFGSNYAMAGAQQFCAYAVLKIGIYNAAAGHVIWSRDDGSANGWYLVLLNPAVTFVGGRGDAVGFDTVSYTIPESDLKSPRHVALVYDGTNLKLALDGRFVASQASSKTVVAATSQLALGKYGGGGSGFDGYIDEAFVKTAALSEATLRQLYEKSGVTPGLRALRSGMRW